MQCFPNGIKTLLHRISLCKVVWSLSANIAQIFQLHNVILKVLRQHWTGFFLYSVALSLTGNIAYGFDLCNVVSRILRQNCTDFFLIQCSTEPLRQHCIGFSPVEFFSKSIQTTFHRNLSYGKSSEAFWVTLHKVFTRAICMYVKFI